MLFNEVACGDGCGSGFDLYEKRDRGKSSQDLLECWDASLGRDERFSRSNAEPKSCVERFQLGECHPLDHPSSVGGAIDSRVVNHHDFAVGRESHVEFQRIGAVGDAEPHRLESILRRSGTSAPVCDHRPSVELEEDVHGNINMRKRGAKFLSAPFAVEAVTRTKAAFAS